VAKTCATLKPTEPPPVVAGVDPTLSLAMAIVLGT